MRVKTAVGQIALVGGGRYEKSGSILADEQASHLGKARARGNLYIVLDVSGPAMGRDALMAQIVRIMRDAYYRRRGSVTAGLQQAIHEANDFLLQENRNSLPGEHRTAGVSCAVLRDDDLFVAQLGPTAAYLASEGQVIRFPDVSPWLDGIPLEELDAAPLGDRREVNASLFHTQVREGDTLLLVDGDLAGRVPDDAWPRILAGTSVDGVLEALLAAGSGRDLSALVVRLAAEEARGRGRPVAAAPRPKAPQQRGAAIQAPISARVADLQAGERVRNAAQTLLAALAGLWAGFLTFVKRMVPERTGSDQAAGRQSTTVRRAEPRKRKSQKARAGEGPGADVVQKILIGVAVAIPLIVAVIVVITVLQRGQTKRAEQEALWQQANTSWEQARTALDPAVARTQLTQAEQSLAQLVELAPDHAEAAELQGKVQARLDLINHVERITWAGELNTYPSDAVLSRVVVQGAHVFVMDRHNGRVYHHRLDEQLQKALEPDSMATVLVNKGDQVGDAIVGDLVDMVWMPPGPSRQNASLVILESGGRLLDYDPATRQLRPLHVAASETWQYPKLVGSHSGRFYLLDSSANQILRYSPTQDGYSLSPETWLQAEVDLAGVVDMAVGDSIYLLYADGGMRKFSIGEPDAFDISDWDAPPNNPAAIFTRPPEDTRWLYVADRGNSRIVQADKEGRFRQQFRLADDPLAEMGDVLAGATSLFVDEIVGHAYLLSGQKLYLLILPMSN